MPRAGLLARTLLVLLLPNVAAFASKAAKPRTVLDLNGTWQVEQGSLDETPKAFGHTIPVPGLLDMAQPAFDEVGKKSSLRQAFWYRRTFKIDGPVPEVAILKLHKACYGTKVILNGHDLGEHLPCFTPAYFKIPMSHLKGDGQENELIVRVGADREGLPKGMPTGWDFEKYLFIPGIYDDVE